MMSLDIKNCEILITCCSRSWGGLEIMALDSAIQLKKIGLRLHFFCQENTSLHLSAVKNNIDTVTYTSRHGVIGKIKILRKILSFKNIDVIHSHLSHDLWTIVPALRLSKSDSSLFLTKHLASGINKRDTLHKYLYNRVDKIIAISSFIKKNVVETCPVPENKIILLQNGVDTNIFSRSLLNENKVRNEFNIRIDKIVIGLIGRITYGKGHEELVNAAAIVNKIYRDKIIFLVTGSAERGEEVIEENVKNLAKEKNVDNMIFTGYRGDIPNILSGIDILTFPSHEESFGITILEAMAMKVPVIASRSAGITDIIPSDEYGILVPPKNYEALANEIIRLIENKELRNKLAENGRKRIVDEFDVAIKTKELIQHYETEIRKKNS